MQSSRIEIMSPVGSMEALHAAIQGGADAVYFGIGKLNMRSRSSKNFSLSHLKEISKLCREKSIRTYLTLNTIIYDEELEEAGTLIEHALTNNISAVIASDLAVMQISLDMGMPVHISTQANITNIQAVKFFSRFADVMVAARELSLEQIKYLTTQIEKQQIIGPSGEMVRIEIFAHGAMCMAVSGKCYLSQDNECHSANRGACLQICRRSYILKDTESGNELLMDNGYILSPKDLCTIAFIDKILDAGVKVLKIEGRGRSADYVKTVTSCYRESADAWEKGSYTPEKAEIWLQKLKSVYNRGFWEGYYLGKSIIDHTDSYGSRATKTKVYVGKVLNFYSKLKVAEVLLETGTLRIQDEIIITGETTGVYEDFVSEIRLDTLAAATEVEKGQVFSIPVRDTVRRGDKLYKLQDSGN